MAEEFDPTPYVRPPIVDVPSGVALGVALLTAMPKDPPDHVRGAAKKLRTNLIALQLAWGKSDAVPATPNKKKADTRIDGAWANLLDRLDAYANLPVADFPKAARARELVDKISPKDREWLKLPYGAEWAESAKRLKKIDDELEADVNALAGPEFLIEVRSAHRDYGVALGITQPSDPVPVANLADPLRALARAIARYGLVVAGMVDDKEATAAIVRKALKPIDDHREGQARRAGSGATPEAGEEVVATPTTPVPEIK